jgi:NAD-dependent dihydropyrimidine dehydrogenase PreA subunit
MSERETGPRRIIEVGRKIIGPTTPRTTTVRPRKLSDFPSLPQAYRDAAARLASPLAMGPPICDELIAFVQHLFTEEEAGVVRHLRPVLGRTAADVAKRERRPVEQIQPILERLANVKRAIAAAGSDDRKKYILMPIMPGIFEMVLIGEAPANLSPWHRRFAELFEALYETGYITAYGETGVKQPLFVRYLPVGRAIEAHPMALPSDQLEVILDRFDTFAVGQCQCRMAMQVVGKGCGRPTENCSVMGVWAKQGIEQGYLRRVSKREMLEIKREAESLGMVNWMMNVESTKGQSSCTCCGCCCHAMRSINEFNAPGAIAPPHFLPKFDDARCTWCGRCAKQCPMGALTLDLEAKTRVHRIERCIGCGQCVVACGDRRGVAMEPVPAYKMPYKSWFSLLLGSAPSMIRTAWRVWRNRGE